MGDCDFCGWEERSVEEKMGRVRAFRCAVCDPIWLAAWQRGYEDCVAGLIRQMRLPDIDDNDPALWGYEEGFEDATAGIHVLRANGVYDP